MKKSSFVAMIMGTVGGIFSALGMCMALLPEWNLFRPGIIFGSIGMVILLATLLVWRKMERKAPIHLTGKTVLTLLLGVVGSLLLGVGMCLAMVWSQMVFGIIVGIAGMIVLLSLIPVVKGIKPTNEIKITGGMGHE